MELKNINIKDRMEYYRVAGLSIALISKGQINMAEGFGILEDGMNRMVSQYSIFNGCSISKFLTSILVLRLVGQGILDLDEDINKKLTSWQIPNNEYTRAKKVTLRTLLSHQSGVMDPEGSFGELDSTQNIPKMVDLLEGKTLYCHERIEVKYEPESDFQYSDAGYCIIQQVIEDTLGRPFKAVMMEQIFEPLNMEKSFIVEKAEDIKDEDFSCGHHKNGKIVEDKYPIYPYPAAAGVWTTATDLALVVIELMSSLKGNSKIGLSKSRAKDIISPQRSKEWAGLGVFLEGSEHEVEISSLGWGKGFQCMLVAYPYRETGAVIMTNTDLGVHQMDGLIGEIYKSLNYKN